MRDRVMAVCPAHITSERALSIAAWGNEYPMQDLAKGKPWGPDRLLAFAKFLGCSVDYIMGLSDDPQSNRSPIEQALGEKGVEATASTTLAKAVLTRLEELDHASIRALREFALGHDSARERIARYEHEAERIRAVLRAAFDDPTAA